MSETFFWHDYETFGASPRTDRPAQFAGIRTDSQLNEIDEPVMIYCKPSLDTLPSPEACLITGITPQHCLAKGVTEREFSLRIERELSQDNTITAGFNNIRFDDEFTRFLFWRNLTDPYAREYKNGCSRWDLMDVVRALYALKFNAITWPYTEDGKPSLKLESLCAENGILHESAHDALSDVRATIGLARLIKQAEPKFFDYCLSLRHKEQVRQQLSLFNKKPILHVSGMLGVDRGYLAIVWPLSMHPSNKNEVIVWDLQADPSQLLDLSADDIKARLFTPTSDLPENITRLPIKTISLNKCPFVINDLRVLKDQRAHALGINLDQIYQHAEKAKNLNLSMTLWRDVYHRPAYDNVDVDEDLYGGFVADPDRKILDSIRRLDKGDLIKERYSFQDARLNELVFRYRARNFFDTLNHAQVERWKFICANKHAQKLGAYLENIETLLTTKPEQLSLLGDLKTWIQSLEGEG